MAAKKAPTKKPSAKKTTDLPAPSPASKPSAPAPIVNNPNPSGLGPSPVSTVSVQKDLQKTAPSVPLASAFPRQEMGDSGTRILHGLITEEYNPQLQGIQGIKIFDEMRKDDGTVRAAMLVTSLPIRRAKWFINPASEEQQDKDIANFTEHALFDWIEGMTWDDVVRQALLMIPFGVMLFEKIYGTMDHDGKTWVTIKQLAPRLPKSIMMWELVDHTFGIQQIRQDGVLAQIPGSKLLIFVNEREGDNWWGTSMLRGAYKHWYYKNNFYKIEAIGFERQAVGVPKITMPAGYTESDEKKAISAAQNLRANEYGYIVLPTGYDAEFMDMGAQSTLKPDMAIEHHNKEILQSVLAQFLELGAAKSTSGSRALSQDHSDLFLKAEESIANTLRDVINLSLIKELVDMNFDNVKVYPKLDYSGITKADVAALGTAYSLLAKAGAINPTDDDQQYLRAAMGLPPRTQEDIDAAADEEPSTEEQEDGADIEETSDDDPEGPAAAAAGAVDDAAKKPKPSTAENKKASKAAKSAKPQAHTHRRLPLAFTDEDGFKSWRPLTFAEQKVTLKKIEDTMDAMQADFSKQAKDTIAKAKDGFVKKLAAALDAGDTKSVAALELDFVAAYKAILKDAMKQAYEFGKNNAAVEMGVASPANSADSLANMDLIADTIAKKTVSDLESKAKISIANSLKTDATPIEAAGIVSQALTDALETSVDNVSGIIIGQSLNNGRNDVFARNQGLIHSLQRSEILDKVTCNFCISMDGVTIEPTDDFATTEIYHTNCRGIWVEVLMNEANPPEITGVPEALKDMYGGQPNALIQPKKPIVKPGSRAEKLLQDTGDLKSVPKKTK